MRGSQDSPGQACSTSVSGTILVSIVKRVFAAAWNSSSITPTMRLDGTLPMPLPIISSGAERSAEAGLSDEERTRLLLASREANMGERRVTDLERSLRLHIESAELRLNPAARDRLLRARRGGPNSEERGKLESDRRKLEEKAWESLQEEERAALVASEPHKFQMPSASDMRFNWVHANLAALDRTEARELVVDAWRMVVPKKLSRAYDLTHPNGPG